MIDPIVHKSRNFKEAETWNIKQHLQMSPEERQGAAKELRDRYYGKDSPDVRAALKSK